MKKNIGISPFGNYPVQLHNEVAFPAWRTSSPVFEDKAHSYLPAGNLRSYGDSCLNEGNNLIFTKYLDHIISFDREAGVIECESGMLFSDLIPLLLEQEWFLPVTPGTKYITVGGAVANDVHGKNHVKAGTFGNHVISFDLLRSDGIVYKCSPYENADLFSSTIGGLGLTGLILSVKFRLRKVTNRHIDNESIKVRNVAHFFEINRESENDYSYTVAWVDCLARGKSLGKGIYYRGNDSESADPALKIQKDIKPLSFPLKAPCINKVTVKAFNMFYSMKQGAAIKKSRVYFEPFYYPLDKILKWNNAYGRDGFLQYQFVIPFGEEQKCLTEILGKISASGMPSFLTVLKTFGTIKSPGMLSFPMPGVTMAIDFRNQGKRTFELLDTLDRIVLEYGGRIYPAKDARVSGGNFKAFYPQWEDFSKFIDPRFSSSYWRRVAGD